MQLPTYKYKIPETEDVTRFPFVATYDDTIYDLEPMVTRVRSRIKVTSYPSGKTKVSRVLNPMGLSNNAISPSRRTIADLFGEWGVSEAEKERQPAKRAKKGMKGMSVYGKDMIASGCSAVDKDQLPCWGLFTLTCPSDDPGDVAQWNECFGEIVRTFARNRESDLRTRLVDVSPQPDLVYDWFYVIEYQKRGALHLHMIVRIRTAPHAPYIYSFESHDRLVKDSVCKVLGDDWGNKNWRSSCNMQKLRHNPARYLSKYLSKSASKVADRHVPTHWWGMSKGMKEWVKERTFSAVFLDHTRTFDRLVALISEVCPLEHHRIYRKRWEQSFQSKSTVLGAAFWQDEEWRWAIASFFNSQFEEAPADPIERGRMTPKGFVCQEL